MKTVKTFAVVLFVGALAACASSPSAAPASDAKPAASASQKAAATKPAASPKDAVTSTFSSPLAATRDAAVAAAKLHGFEVKTTTDTLVSGVRPRKMGLVVGSGGETINIALKSLGETSTEVTVSTKRTFVGGAGQKLWNDPVIEAMKASLATK